jgi:hypothetical protein
MAAGMVRVGLVAFATMSAVAYAQNNVVTALSACAPVHPGTAILDAMGISAGLPAQDGQPVHPGTAILDSMGIFAGLPVPDSPNCDTTAATVVNPK